MIRALQIATLAAALVGATAIAWPATDAGPDAAEVSPDTASAAEAGPRTDLENRAEEDPVQVGREIIAAIKAGRWIAVAGGVGLIISWLGLALIRWAKPSWAKAKAGRYAIAFASQLLVVAGGGALAGVPLGWELAAGWLAVAAASSGLLEWVYDVVPGLGGEAKA